jgi:hypothetical protein
LGPMGATAELSDAESTGVELTLVALALGTAGCCAFGNSVTGAGLLLTEDCGAGIGVVVVIGIGISDGAGVGAEDARATLVAGTPREAGFGLGADARADGPRVKDAAETDGDSTVGDSTVGDWPRAKWSKGRWSREKTCASVGTGAWNRLLAGVGTGETGTGGPGKSDRVCVGKTGAGETGPGETNPVGIGEIEMKTEAVENGAGAAEGCVGKLGDECASPEEAGPMADGNSGGLGPGSVGSSVGTMEFADALAAPESSGGAATGIARLPAVGDTAEFDTAEIAVGAG